MAIEVVSAGDQTREKLDFYAHVATQELLVVNRAPWQLEQYRLTAQGMQPVKTANVENGAIVTCEIVPIDCLLIEGKNRPRIQVTHRDSGRDWTF